jgi:aminoglycoside/choline kinase family phosphotransferase
MSSDQLTHQLQAFFQTDQFEIVPLTDGASPRKYYRLDFREKLYFPETRIVLLTVPVKEIKILTDYMHIDFYLTRMGIPTPKVYEMKRQFGWIFLEYQNLPTLEEYLNKKPERIPTVIADLVEFLIHVQERCHFEENCPAFQRHLNAEKYKYEFDFYVREQLLGNYLAEQLNERELRVFGSFSAEVSQSLDIPKMVFVHGYFQSKNIFYDESKKDIPFKIADFQDARAGSPIYDLVSCLWDSYIPIPENVREGLLGKFFSYQVKAGSRLKKKNFQKLVDYTVVQRKLHDAGVFAYNYHQTKNARFTSFIAPAVAMAVAKMKSYNYLKEVIRIFNRQGEN